MSHTCHHPDCTREVPPRLWGCREHWFALPTFLRNEILRSYVPGQEVTKTPSRQYIAAAQRVQQWIAGFCRKCGARVPHLIGEGRCEACMSWLE